MGGIEYARNRMLDFKNEALEILNEFPQSDARESMKDLVELIIVDEAHLVAESSVTELLLEQRPALRHLSGLIALWKTWNQRTSAEAVGA